VARYEITHVKGKVVNTVICQRVTNNIWQEHA